MSGPENRAVSLDTMNRLPQDSRQPSIRTLLPFLEAWRAHWEAVFLRTIAPMTSRVSATVLQRTRQPLYPAQVVQRWILEFKRDLDSSIKAMAFPEMKKSVIGWLRQPVSPKSKGPGKNQPCGQRGA